MGFKRGRRAKEVDQSRPIGLRKKEMQKEEWPNKIKKNKKEKEKEKC